LYSGDFGGLFPSDPSQPFAELLPGETCQGPELSAAPERGGARVGKQMFVRGVKVKGRTAENGAE